MDLVAVPDGRLRRVEVLNSIGKKQNTGRELYRVIICVHGLFNLVG